MKKYVVQMSIMAEMELGAESPENAWERFYSLPQDVILDNMKVIHIDDFKDELPMEK